ncbi:Hypothetical protein, putative [Bodo saltans]|uniref:Cytochrome c domain-containing protein n=1 Tax=Bodo saltans TaxID=75058 RepID=A0A0S4KHK7_BODSA|nr:Hypothetical protein, putative [Bodo saltans]|eukprot:CUI14422.1 Hypothetical protein, putative [Bodo saltans]
MDAHSDFNESVATSPPTSLAPQSDDEFTTALVRHAAKRLGFEVDDPLYLPSSPQQHARGGGGGPLAVLSHRRLPEILRQLDIRQKALGPNHESLVDLHMQAAKHFEQAGELSKSEHHFTAALDVLETCVGKSSETLLPVLTSLAHFYASRGRFFDAQTMFARAAAVCEACHTGRMAAENPVQSTQPQRLRNALLQWKDRKSTDAVAVELRAGAAAVQAASRRGNVVDADAQTVEEPPQPHVPTLDSSSWQRLQSPSLTTADDMRRLLTVVRQEQPQYQYSSISVQHRTSPSRSSASVAAARSAADVRQLLDELRKAKNA